MFEREGGGGLQKCEGKGRGLRENNIVGKKWEEQAQKRFCCLGMKDVREV